MTDNLHCPACGSDRKVRRGFLPTKTRFQCKNCGKFYSAEEGKLQVPKVLLLDIETSPMEVFVWGLWKQRISPENVLKDWFIISWAAKWLFSPDLFGDVVTPKESLARDDERILSSLWDLLDETDIIVAHNGSGFDIPKINTRLLYNGFTPPSDYKVIDTLSAARKNFSFSSNKQDYITKQLGLPEKLDAPYEMWKECVKGDSTALKTMLEYNMGDVVGLEEMYVRLRPWIKNHPNLSYYVTTEEPVCPKCGSAQLSWDTRSYSTTTGIYRRFRCDNCHSVGRGSENLATTTKRKAITR